MGLWRDFVSASPTHFAVFLICLMYRSHLTIFSLSSRGNYSVYTHSCRFSVSKGGGDFRGLLCHQFGTELALFFPYILLKFIHPLPWDLLAFGCDGNLAIKKVSELNSAKAGEKFGTEEFSINIAQTKI